MKKYTHLNFDFQIVLFLFSMFLNNFAIFVRFVSWKQEKETFSCAILVLNET